MTAKDEWQTPPDLFKKLDDEFHFTVDVAASEKNSKCNRFIDKYLDALTREYGWAIYEVTKDFMASRINSVCWMNPPYSKPNLYNFCKKAYEESQKGCVVVGLLPCDCSTKWWSEFVMKADEIRFLSRRVRFINPDTGKPGGSPTFGSVIVVWRDKPKYAPKVSMWSW